MTKITKTHHHYLMFILLLILMLLTNITSGSAYFSIGGNNKANWLDSALTSIEEGAYPEIRAVSYWHEVWNNQFLGIEYPTNTRIDSSKESLEIYQTHIASENYTTDPIWTFTSDGRTILAENSTGIYHSAYPDFEDSEDVVISERITTFETLAAKEIMWVFFSNNWFNGEITFPEESVQLIHSLGHIPYIRMMARSTDIPDAADPIFQLQNIIDGNFDPQLKTWASAAIATNINLIIEFGTEMNGQWFPWNGLWNGGSVTDGFGDPMVPDGPERFQEAYRHIINLFHNEGAHNITWVFHINWQSFPDEEWNAIENYYPGDDYIDWIGVSIYGPLDIWERWEECDFINEMDVVYPVLTNLFPEKPLALLEFGADEYGETGWIAVYSIVGGCFTVIIIAVVVIIRKKHPSSLHWRKNQNKAN